MSVNIPMPADIKGRMVANLLGQTFTALDGTQVTPDAANPNSFENVMLSATADEAYEVYLYIKLYVARELMPDQAIDWLPRHAAIWKVPRRLAVAATGTVDIACSAETSIPAGTELTLDGSVRWNVTTSTDIAAGATATVSVAAETAGVIGNLAAGTGLTLVSPIAGVTSVTVSSADGLSGGLDLEAIEDWRQRILAAIRDPEGAGTIADYKRWATAGGAAYVGVLAGYPGPGGVSVGIAMSGPRAATGGEVADVAAYIQTKRPVTAKVTILAAELPPVPVQVALNPDSATRRILVSAALAVSFAQNAVVGDPFYQSDISAAIASVTGERSYRLLAPAADVQPDGLQLLVLGDVDYVSPYPG
ncbi:baseplate J/gp47 family protein [Gluconacetobacter azotocaptans]|uniref:baseplate J/gp47 family protein n=1 Tax=Gluconacetobacter azotocaptans TaxID=142834 RepID=UPI00195C015C|nr:baseplate J/gp47 family protein [Gluconacetobacter azotocaptans]MBM9400388.1 baseplate J/gp47 family protein [Gluconacetobacter azotocaptans]